jgi:hypothetical protein
MTHAVDARSHPEHDGFLVEGENEMHRFLAALVATMVGGAAPVLLCAQPASAATPTLPNLRMARLNNFQLGSDPSLPGHTLLRFNATIVNTGAAGGTFEVVGTRSSTSVPTMTVSQIIHNSDGSTTMVPTSATMIYDTGDGHQHWHVKNLETYRVTTPSGRVISSRQQPVRPDPAGRPGGPGLHRVRHHVVPLRRHRAVRRLGRHLPGRPVQPVG